MSRRSLLLLVLAATFGLRIVEWYIFGGPSLFVSQPSTTAVTFDHDCHHKATSTSASVSSSSTPRPRQLRLVLIGDSLMRYTYLSLVYFLRHGEWYDPKQRTPHLVQPTSFDNPFHNQSWGEHAWQTNRMLYPLELCDCYRKSPGRLQVNKVVNNRYFHDSLLLDNFVVYLDAKGHKGSLHGRIQAPNVAKLLLKQQQLANHLDAQQQPATLQSLLSPPFDSLQRPFAWSFTSWADAIRDFVFHLEPPPTHIVMNAGLWPNNFLHQPQLAQDLVEAIHKNHNGATADVKAIWKTTSFGRRGKLFYDSIPATDRFMCQQLDMCWNVSWTQLLPERYYWDDKHFLEPIYRIMNEDLLEKIGALPEGYQRLDRSTVFMD